MVFQMTMFDNLTWTCHVCGRERPDDMIGVMKHHSTLPSGIQVQENVRYCLDNAECARGAITKRFIERKK